MIRQKTLQLKRNQYLLAITISLLFAFTPVRFLSYLITIYIIGRLIRVRFGVIGNTVVAFCLCSSIIACLAGLFWLTRTPLTSGLVLSILSTGLAMIVALPNKFMPSILPKRSEILDPDDMIALVASIAAIVVLLIPVGTHLNVARVLPLIASGGDNSTPYQLSKTRRSESGI